MSTLQTLPSAAGFRRRGLCLVLGLAFALGLAAPLSAATLLKYNFEGSNVWTGMNGYFQTTGGTGTATPAVTTVGTVNTYGATSNVDVNNVASNGIQLLVNSQNATGTWTAGVDSGVLSLLTSNSITNLGLITLSFSLWSSNANPILVRVESYDPTTNLRTGGLKTLIYPATPNFYQRFALDLSKMTSDGTGTFVPAGNSKVRLYFEIGNALGGDGWANASASELHIDNVNYSTPKYYVKPSTPGSDNNNGLTETTPWQTISKAVNAAVAGDIIVLMGSEADQFVASGTSGLVAFKTQRGTPEAWIVLKNYPGQTPILRSSGWNTIAIGNGYNGSRYTGATVPAYIEVRGLTVRGYSSVDANGDRVLPDAFKPYLGLSDPRTNNNGIGIDGRYNDYVMHDLRIADNIVEYCTAAGIGAGETDRLTIENNITRYNTWWSIYGGSGISAGPAIATEVNNDTRMLLQNNQSYGNEGMIPWRSINAFSDGNGIIVDTNQISKTGANIFNFPDFTGRTLVQNNLCYNNGGSGIHSFQSAHVDIIHNTAYHNSASPRLLYSQIFAGYSADVRMMNNVLVAPNNPTGSTSFNEPITSYFSNTDGTVYYQNNVFYGEGNNQANPTNANFINNTTTDPQFLSPSIDPTTNDFHLRSTSPALNNGLTIGYRSALDFAARPRLTTNLTPDRGAYQSQAGDAKAPVFTPQPGNYTVSQSVALASTTTSAKIVYTTDGTVPAVDASGNPTNGTLYTAALPLSAAAALKAIAWSSGLATSYVSSAAYTFVTTQATIPTPTFDVSPTTTDGMQYVSVICATPGALVRYTTDGTNPTTTSGTLASASAIQVTAGNTIKAVAYKSGRSTSAVLSGNFVVRPEIGSMSEGSTTDALGANKIRFASFHPAKNLSVSKIYAKLGAIAGSYRTAIYTDNGGVPGTLLRASGLAVTGPVAGWQGFALSSAVTLTASDSTGNALYYWLAIWSNDAAASVYTTTTGGHLCEAASTFSSSWPTAAPTTTAATNAAYTYSIFATTTYRPVVSAGSNQTLATASSAATLTGTATDNSTPAVPLPASFINVAWSKVSGPGTVTFANGAALATTATFSVGGTYVLRLMGQDTLFTPFAPVTSDVTITVPGGVPAIVTATAVSSSTSVATLGNSLTFTANVTSGSGIPAGTVTFYDGSTSLGSGTVSGTGTVTLTGTLPVGIHSITAAYGGNSSYAASTSSAYSQSVILLDGTTRLVAINAAGPAISGSGFVADTGVTGGSTTSTTATINNSAVTYPAPGSLYQTERYGTFSYSLGGFTPSAAYLVRLHFCESWWGVGTRVNSTVGQRPINVWINGVQRLTGFDVWAAAGASSKAVIREFSAAADTSGFITINFAGTAGSADINAMVNGLEVYTVTPFNAWRVGYFTPVQLDNTSLSGPLADLDKDGVSNLMEYALGTNPLNADATGLPTMGFDADGHLTLTFLRARSDVTYIVEGSADLTTWALIATNPGSVGQSVTVPDNAALSDTPRFMRLRVTQ